MWQDCIESRTRDEYICIVSDPRPGVNPSEAEEEIDRRFGLQIADAIADEGRFSLRARSDVPHDDFLAPRMGKQRSPIEVFVLTGRFESKWNRVKCDPEFRRERLERLLDARRDEVNDAPRLFESSDRFGGAVDDRFLIALREL